MPYNRNKIIKKSDKKVLRKVKKNWIILSLVWFGLVGTFIFDKTNNIVVHASEVSSAKGINSDNHISQQGVSTHQEYADYTRYIDYQESYSDLSTSGKSILPQKVDSVHYIRTEVFNADNVLIGYSSDGSNNVDISLNDSQNGWRPKNVDSSSFADVNSPIVSGYEAPSISTVRTSFVPGSGFSNPSNDPNVTISNGSSGQENAIEHIKVFYNNPLVQYTVKTEYANLTRQIDYVEDSDQSTSGIHIYPSRYDHINYIRNLVFDNHGNLAGYSNSNSTNIDISKDDLKNGWRPVDESDSSLPEDISPNDSILSQKGYSGPDFPVVRSTFTLENGFTNPNNYSNVSIYDGKDNNGNVIELNAYELVTVKYKNIRTSQKDYSNLTRQIDYVNRNDFMDDGTKIPAGYHIYPTRTDTIYYVRTRVYDSNGNLMGYSSNDESNNVDISLTDPSQGWHLANNTPQSSIPIAESPSIQGYISPSYTSYSSDYQPGNGFSNPTNKPNVVINGNPANTYEYVKVVYGVEDNVVRISTKTLTRTVKYVDSDGNEISGDDNQSVVYKRDEVYSPDGKPLLGYASNINNSKTPDISTQDPSQGWILQNDGFSSYNVKNLSKDGYVNPDITYISSDYSGSVGFVNPNNYRNITISDDNNNEIIKVTYIHKVSTVSPENPGQPGLPINPDNPNGPKWPNGTDKDSLTKTVKQTINYVDEKGKILHDASPDEITFTRTAQVDEVTGVVTYGNWNEGSGRFSAKTSPVVTGYVLKDASQKTVGAVEVTPSSSDIDGTVVYEKIGSLVPVDTEGNPIDNGSHNVTYPNDGNDAGKVNNPTIPSINGKTPVDTDGNPLTPGNSYPIDGSKSTEDTKITYVNSEQKLKVVYVDQSSGNILESVELIGAPQSISGYRPENTINSYTNSGYRLVSNNYPEKGATFNSDNKEHVFTIVLVRLPDSNNSDKPTTPQKPVKPDNNKSDGHKVPNSKPNDVNKGQHPHGNSGSDQNGSSKIQELPQTGESNETMVQVGGVIILMISLLIGFFGIKRRN